MIKRLNYKHHLLILCSVFLGCKNQQDQGTVSDEDQTLFEMVPSSHSKVDFINKVQQTNSFNFLNYLDIFNGGGVALADFDNDGLLDIYLTANETSNKLYLNQGDFEFKDVTDKAQVSDTEGWTTGVNVIDINNDGKMDIYVCKSGSMTNPNLRKNKLFINQGDATFTEEGNTWGLDHSGYSVQSYFVDYDKDGDLDMYLVNHRSDFNNVRKVEPIKMESYIEEFSDQLFRNDAGYFTNVTEEAGMGNKTWGLSAAIGDFNEDGWPDIYVANDFIQPDQLYINNKDGSFTDKVLTTFDHISYNSMGSDYEDINNDLLPDLVVLDMLADDHQRSKENMATMDSRGFQYMVDSDYHYPYMANMLQLNQGKGNFDEIGQLASISKTDWSWAPLIADFDNDGHKDLFISNGIEKDLGNQDFRTNLRSTVQANPKMNIDELENLMPGEKLANYMFKNNGNLEFKNVTEPWGLNIPMNSNGAAYGDLDNDGDLDIVVNNSSDKAALFKNNSKSNYIKIALKGSAKNRNALGTQVKIVTENGAQSKENYFAKGFQSAMAINVHFGIGRGETVQRIEVIWPDSTFSVLENVKGSQKIVIDQKNTSQKAGKDNDSKENYLTKINPGTLGIDFIHSEFIYDDFKDQVLLPQKLSQLGPDLVTGDLNNDGLDDVILSGAKYQEITVFLQTTDGRFTKKRNNAFEKDRPYETIGLHLFDYDGDGDLDLYAANGSYEFEENSNYFQDILYANDGYGNFSKTDKLPEILSPTKKIKSFDYDGDGDLDLFVGGRLSAKKYPLPPKSYILQNNKGTFVDMTSKIAPEFENVGMVTDMVFSDFDGDGDKDLIVVGEWMPVSFFENTGGAFYPLSIEALDNSEGWWQSIAIIDIDNDGDDDYLLGNLGKNNKFHPTLEKPLHVYASYLDDNASFDMVLSKVYKGKLVPTRGKECSSQQNPFLTEKYQSYKEFANSSLEDMYGEQVLEESYHAVVKNFRSSLLINQSSGNFALTDLTNEAQKGPTLGFEVLDFDGDGSLDVVGIGAIHEAEVETIRYDGNHGYVLLNKNGKLEAVRDTNFHVKGNAKGLQKLIIDGIPHLIIGNNNGEVELFALK